MHMCLLSSVAEHWSRKPGAVSSILTGGKIFFQEWIESQFTREETGFICAQGLAYCSFDQMSQIFFKQPDSTPNLQTIYNSNTNIHLSTNVSVKAYIISDTVAVTLIVLILPSKIDKFV